MFQFFSGDTTLRDLNTQGGKQVSEQFPYWKDGGMNLTIPLLHGKVGNNRCGKGVWQR